MKQPIILNEQNKDRSDLNRNVKILTLPTRNIQNYRPAGFKTQINAYREFNLDVIEFFLPIRLLPVVFKKLMMAIKNNMQNRKRL